MEVRVTLNMAILGIQTDPYFSHYCHISITLVNGKQNHALPPL
jgi:hypothetical protein